MRKYTVSRDLNQKNCFEILTESNLFVRETAQEL